MTRKLDKERSIQLRKEGKSLNQIVKIVNASKGSVSAWIKPVELTKDLQRILNNRKIVLHWTCHRGKRKRSSIHREKVILTPETIKRRRNTRMSTYRNNIKFRAVEYKGGKCSCGYNKCIDAMEFHHINPNEKDFGIARYPYGWEKLKIELDKCILLCSNCHKELHFNLRNNTDTIKSM